jgi:hypothetical protein
VTYGNHSFVSVYEPAPHLHRQALFAGMGGCMAITSLYLFMIQRDVLPVAKFVQQLQHLMDTLLRAPTDDFTTYSFLWFAFFVMPLLPAIAHRALCLFAR